MSTQGAGKIKVGMLVIDERTETPCRVVEVLKAETIGIMGDDHEVEMFRVTDGDTEWDVAGFNLTQAQLTTVGKALASGSYGVSFR